MQVLSIEHMACAEALALRRHLQSLQHKAPASERSRTFRTWLLAHGGKHISDGDLPMLTAFLQLLRWYHRTLCTMKTSMLVSVDLGTVRCVSSGELLHIAAVPCGIHADGQLLFHSLSHTLENAAHSVDSLERKREEGLPPPRISVTERLPLLLDAAQDFGSLFAFKVGRMTCCLVFENAWFSPRACHLAQLPCMPYTVASP
jgi:hypothetical protein